ncbi:MAG: phosphatase PAP2 family protein [Myxococcales bacterium]|nr:phosphatase PAP2 family protein [Myxococcales bacterium]MCB9577965.1 phosphatase PAP2 family protein [Polyangiaceae bacterium]
MPASPLTPVVPEPEAPPKRAYQLYWQLDVPLLVSAGVLSLGRSFRTAKGSAPAYCTTTPEGCDKSDLAAWDRPYAGTYEPRWNTVSDLGAGVLLVAPIPLLSADEGFLSALNDSVVVYESTVTAVALSALATLSTSRARPFVYGTSAPESVRKSPDGALSFISGHTTASFALSTSLFWTVERRHHGSAYTWAVFGVGTAVATTVGISRVKAGKHFPSDVVAGALVGASIGTLIPALHDTPVRVTPEVDKERASLSLSGIF